MTPERRAGPAVVGEPSTPLPPARSARTGLQAGNSAVWVMVVQEDTGYSLANTGLRSASLDLPYLKSEWERKKSEALHHRGRKASASTRISAADVAKRCQAQSIPAWGTECAR